MRASRRWRLRRRTKKKTIAACGFACVTALATTILAQQPTTAPAGLDALSDQRLMSELASRGLNSLLDRAFEINHMPPSQRDGLRTVIALRQLSDPKVRMSTAQRQAAIQKIAAGIEQALPTLTDPQSMVQQANALLDYADEHEVNTLEYWGENAKTQAALRPAVEVAVKLLDKAAAEAQTQADSVANTIAGPNDANAKRWEELSNLATMAAYRRHIEDYGRALSYDRASPQRKQIADEAIKFLAQFDNADSTVQPIVRVQIGKLHMAAGDFDQAEQVLATVAAAKDITPPPNAFQQWEARYFTGVCELLKRDADAAQKSLNDLIAWQGTNLPKDKNAQDGAVAAASMLQYRIDSLRAELASDEATRKRANDTAVATLMGLVKRRPDLQSVIFEQVMSKLPADADLKQLDPLLLQGLIVRADDERRRPDTDKADQAILRPGIDAPPEIIRRKNAIQPGMLHDAA